MKEKRSSSEEPNDCSKRLKPELQVIPEQVAASMRQAAKEIGPVRFINEYVLSNDYPIASFFSVFNPSISVIERVALHVTLDADVADLLPPLTNVIARYVLKRECLSIVSSIDQILDIVQRSEKIIVLTGAGVSVNCGIPDFRSKNGIYARLKKMSEFRLDDPQEMVTFGLTQFDIDVFRYEPAIFYTFAKDLYPSDKTPSTSHMFIAELEKRGKLLRNYTQNIDTLEQKAGITRVVQCHGSFATASCIKCKFQVPGEDLKEYVLAQTIAYCPECKSDPEKEFVAGIMKPDITFFGEKLPDLFDRSFQEDRDFVDFVVVIGSSLKVMPVSGVISHVPHSVPQLLINKEMLPHLSDHFDVVMLGDCDVITRYLAVKLGWEEGEVDEPKFLPPNVYYFEGARVSIEVAEQLGKGKWDIDLADSDDDDDSTNISSSEDEEEGDCANGEKEEFLSAESMEQLEEQLDEELDSLEDVPVDASNPVLTEDEELNRLLYENCQ